MLLTPSSLKRKPFKFRPPKNNQIAIWLAKQFIVPILLHRDFRVKEVELAEEDLGRLKELKGNRVILTPNHSGGKEPYILFHLSKILKEEFNYLSAREVFEDHFPWGWLLQRVGAYSIIRGAPDRNSFRMTQQLLREGRRWIVIFPEGLACGLNDTVMPFQQGVAQFAFWACDDLAKHGDPPPIYFVPVAIKYVYLHEMWSAIDSSLRLLEGNLLLPACPECSTLFNRLHRVGEAVLHANEQMNNVRPPKDATFNDRIHNMKELIVSRVAATIGVSLRLEQPLHERIRELFNAIDQIVYTEVEGTEYERKLHRRRQQKAREFYNDLVQVLQLIALYASYPEEKMTAEQFLDVLALLEFEILGKKEIRGPKKALVKVGEPLDLRNYYSRYRADKGGTLHLVMQSVESSVKQMLMEMSSFPLYGPAAVK
jgi:1-acyl-sn-glycerol-3-phosphate acyltransferase